MVQNTTSDGGTERENKRFETEVSGDVLQVGDRVDKQLVARTPGQYGGPVTPALTPDDEEIDTQLVAVTAINNYDDVHWALLLDPETGTFVRASRHDSNQAWSQAEADWTVRAVGTDVVVKDVTDLERLDEEADMPADEYVDEWVDILFGEIRYDHTNAPDDERTLSGTTLSLRDIEGRRATAIISLED